ncbi:MAG: ABC transporter substrate-binding protein, partial [Lachnospiraceae bacterium]|nr:ABC transporter substrate-binding protein [Lachnospiraceae bacterium]
IENVTKSVRRKEEINDAYMEELYADMTSLYRLDQGGVLENMSVGEKDDLGPLPTTAVALLSVLAGAWILILLYAAYDAYKNKRRVK